ncbi:MAG: PilN domain-containing protein [Betaproteobacteria bacterium]
MIRINLLPYREEARKARRKQFFSLVGMVAVLGGLVVLLVYTAIEGAISRQDGRNDFLKKEIVALDKQIEEIKRLKEQTSALLARKQIIESLQRDRSETVYLLSEMVKQVPEGIYLKSLKQEGARINLIGYAQSNARVSSFMRNIENSQWLEAPQLVSIKASTVANRRLNEFVMNVNLKRTKAVEPSKTAAVSKEKK